jgi:hypothetical protein
VRPDTDRSDPRSSPRRHADARRGTDCDSHAAGWFDYWSLGSGRGDAVGALDNERGQHRAVERRRRLAARSQSFRTTPPEPGGARRGKRPGDEPARGRSRTRRGCSAPGSESGATSAPIRPGTTRRSSSRSGDGSDIRRSAALGHLAGAHDDPFAGAWIARARTGGSDEGERRGRRGLCAHSAREQGTFARQRPQAWHPLSRVSGVTGASASPAAGRA